MNKRAICQPAGGSLWLPEQKKRKKKVLPSASNFFFRKSRERKETNASLAASLSPPFS